MNGGVVVKNKISYYVKCCCLSSCIIIIVGHTYKHVRNYIITLVTLFIEVFNEMCSPHGCIKLNVSIGLTKHFTTVIETHFYINYV
jgi:hypothetical protein